MALAQLPDRGAQPVRLICLILLCLMQQQILAQPSEEVDEWVQKMVRAIRQESYDGIFTYMRGHELDTVRIVHGFAGEHEVERLVNLNGEQRETIRRDDEVICYHAGPGPFDLNHDVAVGPFSRTFNDNLVALKHYYHFVLRGKDRVAGRETVKIEIIPKRIDRYGYMLWLDAQTGLLLQSHLVYGPRVLEVFQFSRVEIGQRIDPVQLTSAIGAGGFQHKLTPDLINDEQSPAQWRVAWLPEGFKRATIRQQGADNEVFTDGIATFSVFVEQKLNSVMPEVSTRMGGTVVISRRLQGSSRQITVVGELPPNTARKVAESVEPAIY